MALAPYTFEPDESDDDLDDALTHTHENLAGCDDTQTLAAPFVPLIQQLDAHRATHRNLERILSALVARRVYLDDRLNKILDRVKDLFEPFITKTKTREPESWALAMHADCFAGVKPADARKHTLGPQVEIQRFWEKKLANAPVPALVQAGVDNTPIIAGADALAADIAVAEAAVDQFITVTWPKFVDACNSAMKLVYGQLSDLEHTPPNGVPLPLGFVDRFFLRGSTPRGLRPAELNKMIPRLEARLALLKEMREEQAQKKKEVLRAKALKALQEAQAESDAIKKAGDDVAERLAKAQEDLAKLDAPDGKTPPEK